jgi:hypothetical protein
VPASTIPAPLAITRNGPDEISNDVWFLFKKLLPSREYPCPYYKESIFLANGYAIEIFKLPKDI